MTMRHASTDHLDRLTVRLAGVAATLSLACVLACGSAAPQPAWNGAAVEPPTPAPALAGTNWNGDSFGLADHDGQVRVVFFGYTYCPDICPMALAKMKQLVAGLDARAEDVAVVFVSVDPNRDTVDKLSRYVPGFDPRFYGLHIEPNELDAIADDFGVTIRYGRPPDGGDGNRYLVDHTGTFFIVDRAGQLRLTFPPNATASEMLPDIEILLAEDAAA